MRVRGWYLPWRRRSSGRLVGRLSARGRRIADLGAEQGLETKAEAFGFFGDHGFDCLRALPWRVSGFSPGGLRSRAWLSSDRAGRAGGRAGPRSAASRSFPYPCRIAAASRAGGRDGVQRFCRRPGRHHRAAHPRVPGAAQRHGGAAHRPRKRKDAAERARLLECRRRGLPVPAGRGGARGGGAGHQPEHLPDRRQHGAPHRARLGLRPARTGAGTARCPPRQPSASPTRAATPPPSSCCCARWSMPAWCRQAMP